MSIKMRFFIAAVLFFPLCVWGQLSSSSHFQWPQAGFDSGGITATANAHQTRFQSLGPVFKGASSGDDKKMIHGLHFSSNIYALAGLSLPYSRATLPLSLSQSGLITTQVEFIAKVNGVTVNLGIDTDRSDGWGVRWNTLASVPSDATVTVLARAYDGLSWSAWFQTTSFTVDNQPPQFLNINLVASGMALNSSRGSLVANWSVTDNIHAAVTYDVYSASNIFNPKVVPGLRMWFDARDPRTLLVQKGRIDTWVDKSGKHHNATQSIPDFRPIVGKDAVHFDGSQYLTMPVENGYATSNRFSVFAVLKAGSPSQNENSVMMMENGTSGWGMSAGTNKTWKMTTGDGGAFLTTENPLFNEAQKTMLTAVYNGTQSKLWVNGADPITQTTAFSWDISVYGSLGGSLVSSNNVPQNFLNGDISEILVFDRLLTEEERRQVETYLDFKWMITGEAYTWSPVAQGQTPVEWSASSLADNAWFVNKIVAHDAAGNTSVTLSAQAMTPDRTPPVIGKVDAGKLLEGLTLISGTEDVHWTTPLSAYKWDDSAVEQSLTWQVTPYTTLQNPYKSAEDVLKNAYILPNTVDDLHFIVSPNANTGDSVGIGIKAGNRYGKEAAFIKLTLRDDQGNSVSQDVRIHVKAVNDPPFFKTTVGDTTLYRDPSVQNVVYNIRFNEGDSPPIRLDDFIDDVDDVMSDLALSVSGNAVSQVGNIPYSADVYALFRTTYLAIKIGSAASGHAMTLTSSPYWYGDQPVTLNISDNHPQNGVASQKLIFRIWPVNHRPIIASTIPKTFVVNEGSKAVLNLNGYKNDVLFEDVMPTYNNKLQWKIPTPDVAFVSKIEGQNTSNILSITPQIHRYGTTSMVLQLQDTDDLPTQVFAKPQPDLYIPQPKVTTVSISVTWLPINDPPVISTISRQIKSENDIPWSVPFDATDVEDAYSKLTVTMNVTPAHLVSYVMDKPNKVIVFTPQDHTFGTANVTLSVTDYDQDIAFTPYTPNPKTTTRSFEVKLNWVNQIPTVSALSIQTTSPLTTRLLTQDKVTVQALGYADWGYQEGHAVSVNGSEYTQPDNSALGFTQNSPYFNYRYSLVSGNRTVSTTLVSSSTASTNTYSITPAMSGATLNIEVWPNDKVADGVHLIKTLKVNSLPTKPVPVSPFYDTWLATHNMTFRWNAATDSDGDAIEYRVKFWKVAAWDSSPPSVNIDSVAVYDTGWQPGNFTSLNVTFQDGYYYWKVYSGNKFSPTQWDFSEPKTFQKFNIDSTNPNLEDRIQLVNVVEIDNSPGHVIEDAGTTRILYGVKPSGPDGTHSFSVFLEDTNTQLVQGVSVVSHNVIEIAPLTSSANWAYQITYPPGVTTYNVFLRDNTGSSSPFHTFTIGEDKTPPAEPVIQTSGLSFNSVSKVFLAVSSANYLQVTGNREANTSLWFDGVEIVGFSNTPSFSFLLYPEKSSGRLTARDRAGNESPAATINIQFVVGSPGLNIVSQNRTVINSPDNPLIATLASELKTAISYCQFTWRPDRDIIRYQLVNSGGQSLLSGAGVAKGSLQTNLIPGNSTALSEGDNVLTLKGYDSANNLGTSVLTLTRDTTPPTTNIINSGEISLVNNKWNVDINGKIVKNGTMFVLAGGIEQYVATYNNNTWKYINHNFDMANVDLVLKVSDPVFNSAQKVLWNHLNYRGNNVAVSALKTDANGILYPYSSLPKNLLKLVSKPFRGSSAASRIGMSAVLQQSALEPKMESPELRIPAELKDTMVQIYGETWEGAVSSNISLLTYDIRIGLTYPETLSLDTNSLVAVYFNPTKGVWEKAKVPQTLNVAEHKMDMTLDKAGVWALAADVPFSTTLEDVRVYPNPWVPEGSDTNKGTLSGGITFDHLSSNCHIRIYTVSGQLVRQMDASNLSSWSWDGKNTYGKDVFSGVYIYIILDGDLKKTGKLTVIR